MPDRHYFIVEIPSACLRRRDSFGELAALVCEWGTNHRAPGGMDLPMLLAPAEGCPAVVQMFDSLRGTGPRINVDGPLNS